MNRPVLDRLVYMFALDVLAPGKIRNRAGELQHSPILHMDVDAVQKRTADPFTIGLHLQW